MASSENLIVVIPAYEPTNELVDYVRTLSKSAAHIVVINDGSGEAYAEIFAKISAIEGTVCLEYGENRGKGYALKHAFSYCAEHFSDDDIIVTADADGQHKACDVLSVWRAACEHTGALILGSRDFREECVPTRSRFGNNFTRRLYAFLYGIRLYDTQTGLRGFSVALARRFIGIGANRFEYELAQLIYAKWQGINVVEIPIQTVYQTDEEGHRSHFRPVKDSARVMGVMLSNLGSYAISSVLSAIADVMIFFLISTVLLPDGTWHSTLIATVTARVISSVLNFILNYKYVFSGKERRSLLRYYILWLIQLCFSYGFVWIISRAFGIYGIWLTLIKGAWDLILAVASYKVQGAWVFATRDPHRFWSPLVRAVRGIADTFSAEYRCNVIKRDEPVLYVARHLDMHGPYTTIKWLPFDFHPMIFSVFFDRQSAYRQFADYTFTVREGKKAGRFNFKAWVYSIIAPPIIKGVGGIPVYRDKRTVRTLKLATDALLSGEAVCVYADVDYTAPSSRESELYSGFLYIGEMYYKKSGKSLKIIPIYIDDAHRTVYEGEAVTVDDYRKDADKALPRLKAGVNGRRAE